MTAEEHLLDGGLGSQVARAVAKSKPVPMEFVGIQNTYAESERVATVVDCSRQEQVAKDPQPAAAETLQGFVHQFFRLDHLGKGLTSTAEFGYRAPSEQPRETTSLPTVSETWFFCAAHY